MLYRAFVMPRCRAENMLKKNLFFLQYWNQYYYLRVINIKQNISRP